MGHETSAEFQGKISASAEKKRELSMPVAVVIAGVLVAGAIILSGKTGATSSPLPLSPEDQPAAVNLSRIPESELALRADDHVFGNPNADVLIIEYSDAECPFCKRFHETMLRVMDEYGKNGSIAWVYRHFPLDQLHPKARKEAEALECANELGGNDIFWKYAAKLFEVTPSNNGLDAAQLPAIAKTVGLEVATFNSCLTSGKYASRVEKDVESGASIGVKGTPFSIAWNKKTKKQLPIGGAYPLEDMKNVLSVVMK